MTQATFTNPANGNTYVWPVNPHSEATAQRLRQIERTSNTGNVGATKQQGDDGPHILDFEVNVRSTPTSTTAAMETALWQWYVLARKQTIYFTDWTGDKYEGQIIAMQRQRQLGPVNGSGWAVYQVLFEVYAFLAGPLADAGVTP
jgi:hypothetical protein